MFKLCPQQRVQANPLAKDMGFLQVPDWKVCSAHGRYFMHLKFYVHIEGSLENLGVQFLCTKC